LNPGTSFQKSIDRVSQSEKLNRRIKIRIMALSLRTVASFHVETGFLCIDKYNKRVIMPMVKPIMALLDSVIKSAVVPKRTPRRAKYCFFFSVSEKKQPETEEDCEN
jgi:hypothetical protein